MGLFSAFACQINFLNDPKGGSMSSYHSKKKKKKRFEESSLSLSKVKMLISVFQRSPIQGPGSLCNWHISKC